MKKGYLFLFIIASLFLFSRIPLYSPLLSDENNYFYLGKLISEGKTPYKDFFFAHPPLQIYLFGILFKLAGFNYFLLKSVATLFTLLSAYLIYELTKKYGTKESILAVFLFLFTTTVFYSGSINYGINIAATLVLLSYYLLTEKRKPFLAGMGLALAALTVNHVLPIAAGFLIFLLLKNRSSLQSFLSGFLTLILPLYLLLQGITQGEFIRQVFFYHVTKPPIAPISKIAFITDTVISDFLVILPFLLVLFFLIAKRKALTLPLITIIIYTLFTIILQQPFRYYFIIIYPLMALLIAKHLFKVLPQKKLYIFLIVYILFFGIFMNLKWLHHYQDNHQFTKTIELATYIGKGDASIWGDYHITPLVALSLSREMSVSANLDTYPLTQYFLDTNAMISQLQQEKPEFFLVHEQDGQLNPLWKETRMQQYLNNYCNFNETPMKEFQENKNIYRIYECTY